MGNQQLPPSLAVPFELFGFFWSISQELFGTPGISECSWSPRAPGCYQLAAGSEFSRDFCPELRGGESCCPGSFACGAACPEALAAVRESRGFPGALGLAQLPPPQPRLAWKEEEGREIREGKGLSHPVSLILGGVGGRMCRSAASQPAHVAPPDIPGMLIPASSWTRL